jgi:hypothetical protein
MRNRRCNMIRAIDRMCWAVAAVLLVAGSAGAQVEPWKVTGGGPAPDGASIFGADSPHSATGTATHMGKYSGDGVFNSLSFDPSTGAGTFHGTFTFVAANGDKLACTYGDRDNGARGAGTYQVYPVDATNVYIVFVAEFNPVPSNCTGNFKNVVGGSLVMVAVTEPFPLSIDADGFTPPFNYAWKGEGSLQFQRGR